MYSYGYFTFANIHTEDILTLQVIIITAYMQTN